MRLFRRNTKVRRFTKDQARLMACVQVRSEGGPVLATRLAVTNATQNASRVVPKR